MNANLSNPYRWGALLGLLVAVSTATVAWVVQPTRLLPEERAVRDYIRERVAPHPVEFVQWGPHDLKGELGFHWTSPEHAAGVFAGISPEVPSGPPDHLVRVCYRVRLSMTVTDNDNLFCLSGGKVLGTVTILGPLVMPNANPLLTQGGFPVGGQWQEPIREHVEKSKHNLFRDLRQQLMGN